MNVTFDGPRHEFTEDELKQAERMVKRIRPTLRGQGGPMQGIVLAELVATWVVGHHSVPPGTPPSAANAAETEELRGRMLGHFCHLVAKLAELTDTTIEKLAEGGYDA
jgi:hypothetical protein